MDYTPAKSIAEQERCHICGKEVPPTRNRRKYQRVCKECQAARRRNYTHEYDHSETKRAKVNAKKRAKYWADKQIAEIIIKPMLFSPLHSEKQVSDPRILGYAPTAPGRLWHE